jgi:HEPN domain-containing protein
VLPESAPAPAAPARQGARHEWACFLYEQAAQLALKGLLHGLGLDAWGHDLTVLCARAATELPDLWPAAAQEFATRLSRHYIPTRYPDAHASGAPATHYTAQDADQAEADARAIGDAVRGTWRRLGGVA